MWDWVIKTSMMIEKWLENEVNVQMLWTVIAAAFIGFISCSLVTNWKLVQVNGVWYGLRGRCDKDGKEEE